jgi:hypothetical protein
MPNSFSAREITPENAFLKRLRGLSMKKRRVGGQTILGKPSGRAVLSGENL